MEFSLFYFSGHGDRQGADKYSLLVEGAKFADRNDFAAVWIPERHFHPFGGLYSSPSVLAAAVAMVTSRVQIRAGSVVLPLNHPVRVAEEWSIVDNLSRGRVAIAFASGWHANDFVLAPDAYQSRRQRMDEGIETVRRLWRGEAVSMRDGMDSPVEVRTLPRPIQPELPIWITSAGSPETFAKAGAGGHNLLTHLAAQDVDELGQKVAAYRRALSARGDGRTGHVTVMAHAFLAKDENEVRQKAYAPFQEYIRSNVSLFQALGKSHGMDMSRLSDADREFIVERGTERYFKSRALLGTVGSCLPLVRQLKRIGVDEIACLVDFGVDDASVLAGLSHINTLRIGCEVL